MASGASDPDLFTQLTLLSQVGAVGDLTDGQLVARFLAARDGSAQAVFTVLVERHGPMVLRVCRHVLGDSHDAQDAFQATFLVLAKKVGSVRKAESVASWLYGVALRVAARARTDAARRRVHERRGGAVMKTTEEERPSWPELHEEIARLPVHYREPLVLCYFEGLSAEAAALRIGCPKGTILSRLSRAREKLRRRLIRRGVAPAAVLTASAPAAEAMALPSALLEPTVKAALGFAGRDAPSAAVASAAATTLAREVLLTMSLSKLKLVGVSVLASLLTIGGAQGLAYQFEGGGQDEPEKAVPAEDRQAALSRAVDRLQRELDAATRRNDDLKRQLIQLRRELNALKGESAGVGVGTSPTVKTKEVVAPRDLDELTRRNEELKSQLRQSQRELRAAKGASPAKQQLSPFRKSGGFVAPRAMPPGLGGGFGVPNDPNAPISMNWGRLMIVMSPERDKLVSFNPATKEASSFSTAGTKGAGSSQLIPIMNTDVVAVMVKASQITRIAAARQSDGIWNVQDLREPVSGQATPLVGPHVAVYRLGRYLYAFSSLKGKWDVIELPEGVDGIPSVSAHSAKVEAGGHIYTFSVESAEWSDLDLNAVLKAPGDEDPKKASSPK